jgi:hypothetical protein
VSAVEGVDAGNKPLSRRGRSALADIEGNLFVIADAKTLTGRVVELAGQSIAPFSFYPLSSLSLAGAEAGAMRPTRLR